MLWITLFLEQVYDPMLRNMPPIENMAKPTQESVGRKFSGFLSEMEIACGKADVRFCIKVLCGLSCFSELGVTFRILGTTKEVRAEVPRDVFVDQKA